MDWVTWFGSGGILKFRCFSEPSSIYDTLMTEHLGAMICNNVLLRSIVRILIEYLNKGVEYYVLLPTL